MVSGHTNQEITPTSLLVVGDLVVTASSFVLEDELLLSPIIIEIILTPFFAF